MAILSLILDVVLLGALAALALAAGRHALSRAGALPADPVERDFLGLTIGLFLLAYATLALGLVGLLDLFDLGLVLLLAALVALPELRTLKLRWHRPELWQLLLGAAALGTLLFNHVPASEIDELGYHMALPALFARAHGLVDRPDNWCGYYPLTGEMLITAGMVVRGAGLARLWSWLFGLFAAFGVYAVARREAGPRVAALAGVVYYTMPLVTVLSGSAYPDQFMVAVCLAAFLSCRLWAEEGHALRWAAIAGLLAGVAMSARYTGLAILVILPVLVVREWRKARPFPLPVLLEQCGAAAAVSALVMLPWLARNIVLQGNPLYPRSFLGLHGDPFFPLWFVTGNQAPGATLWFQALELPRRLTALSATYSWGPLPVAFAPLLLLMPGKPRWLGDAAIAGGVALGVPLLLLVPNTRYFVLAFPFAAILAAYAAVRCWEEGGRGSRLWVGGLTAAGLLLPGLALSGFFALKRLPYHLGLKSADDYLAAKRAGEKIDWPMDHRINMTVAPGSTVFVMGQLFGEQFYHPDVRMIGMDAFPLPFFTTGLAEAVSALKGQGVTHVLYIPDEFREDRYWKHFEPKIEFETSWLPEALHNGTFVAEFQSGASTLYRLAGPKL